MNNTLLDNSEKFLMKDILQSFIGCGKYNHICIATGYWDLPGTALVYDQLKTFLEGGGRLDILIGQEPQLRSYQTHAPESEQERFPDFYLQRDVNLLADKYRPTAELIQKYCNVHKHEGALNDFKSNEHEDDIQSQDDSQIQIRVFGQSDPVKKQFLHAKCYIFLGAGEADGIIGSSNFTERGLEDNAELNYLETQNSIVTAPFSEYSNSKSHKVWFDEKWEQSVPWNGKFLQILAAAPVGHPKQETEPQSDVLTPYELYIKLLQTKFGNLVDKNLDEVIASYLPERFDKYSYQIDAVKQCFSTMKEHGGFLLADVVGLGKTVVGSLVIKYFLQVPDDVGRERRVLIITPPAIKSSWVDTIQRFDENAADKMEDCIDYITTGSIGKLTAEDGEEDLDGDDHDTGDFESELKHENYGLIIIDESHKFRNSGTNMYQALDNLISQIGADTGAYPYIGLLSATPQNNRPDDLKNQIYLFERNHADTTLTKAKSGNLENFFSEVNAEYSGIIHPKDDDPSTPEERRARLKALSRTIRDCVLADIMVRRTRTDVQKYYKDDMERRHLKFPTIEGPHELKYQMDSVLSLLFAETMDIIAPTEEYKLQSDRYLSYYRYRAIQYLADETNKKKYDARGSRDADTLAEQLAKIMQINLVKRLESSFSAFYQSLLNLRQYTRNMIDMWESGNIFICPQINVNAELDRKAKKQKRHKEVSYNDCIEDIRAKIEKLNEDGRNDGDRNMEYHRNDMKPEYIELLRADYDLISELCDRWAKNTEDPKLDVFKDNLKNVLFDKTKNEPQKLVVFSEAIDTVDTIKRVAEAKGYKVLKITAANRDVMEQTIRENFDANYKGEWKDDFNIIVTTEVLAEGVNLHRANVILNYDTPWNSTRLMQRIGRVNRIGSTQDKVYVFNFKPSAEGDAEIQLVDKAYTKLQSFHTLFGEDSKVYTAEEEVSHYDLNTVVNGEESPLEKYIYTLKQYKKAHPGRYEYILNRNENLECATRTVDGNCYFLVRTPRMSGLFVKVSPADSKGRIISASEMYESFSVPQDAPLAELPEHWEEDKNTAEKAVNQHLHKMNVRIGNSNKATKAKEILRRMQQDITMSQQSKSLLADAFTLVNKGNPDIIRKVLAFEEKLNNSQGDLFGRLTQQDFDLMIEREIRNIVANLQQRYGKAEVYIGLSK
jgi:superfamily II DNA or RNA helicase